MPTRILIVEDEPAIADNISYALSTDGYEPMWRTTGEAALKEASAGNIGLIILDVGLPNINGFELYRKLARITSAPVIFLTARAAEVDRIVGLELGADDYVSKPGERFLLHRALANLLANAIDFSSAGQQVTLTVKPSRKHCEISVRDHGPGIPDYALDRVFEKFYSLRRPESGKKGTGLGLSFVKEIAELH